jgi:hypothetical protein
VSKLLSVLFFFSKFWIIFLTFSTSTTYFSIYTTFLLYVSYM